MEDLLDNCHQEYLRLSDQCYASADPEEIMRRVPGVTREEAEYIRTMGLTPDEEVEIAYWYKKILVWIYTNLSISPILPDRWSQTPRVRRWSYYGHLLPGKTS